MARTRGSIQFRSILLALGFTLPFAVVQALTDSTTSSISSAGRKIENAALDLDYRVRYALPSIAPARPPQSSLVLLSYDDATRHDARNYKSVFHQFAALLERIKEAKPRAVFFDITFNYDDAVSAEDRDRILRVLAEERESGAPPDRIHALETLAEDSLGGAEARLIDAYRGMDLILPMPCIENPTYAGPDDPSSAEWNSLLLTRAGAFEDPGRGLISARPVTHFIVPIRRFFDVTRVAQSCEVTDSDGILRRDPTLLVTARGGRRWLVPSAAVQVARAALGPDTPLRLEGRTLLVGDRRVPLDEEGASLIDFTGPAGSFASRAAFGKPVTYSARLLTAGELPLDRLRDKVVLLGTTAPGSDEKHTPFAERPTPGVEKIAMQADSILTGPPPSRPDAARRFGFLITTIISLAAAGIALAISPRAGFLAAPLGSVFVLAGGALLFTRAGIWLETGFPALATLASGLIVAAQRYRASEADRRFVESAFGKYLAPQTVKMLLEDREKLSWSGEEREMTILFADLRGFTSSCENRPAADIVQMLNEHFTGMHEAILRHGGVVNKFIGDCVMAYWGAPIADPDHAVRACRASLEMLEILDAQNDERRRRGEPLVGMGIGLSSGKVIVGNMGSKELFDYTVIGDAVNLASRLEGLTKDAACRVLVGERTRDLVEGVIPTDPLGSMPVKGKAATVPIFGLSASRKAVSPTKTGPATAAEPAH